jgi:hypothetical protein
MLIVDSHDHALLALYRKPCETCNTPRNKKCSLSVPGVGVVKATCKVIHSEGLTMNVRVVLEAKDSMSHRKEKRKPEGQSPLLQLESKVRRRNDDEE